MLIGLIYIVLWEGSVATFAPQANWLSVGAYGRSMIAEGLPGRRPRERPVDLGRGLDRWCSLIASTLFTALATRRLSRVELP